MTEVNKSNENENMNTCLSEETLMLYFSRRLPAEEVSAAVLHIAACQSCRAEAALLARLKAAHESAAEPLPDRIKQTAYNLLPAQHQTLSDYVNELSDHLKPALDALELARTAASLALSCIG